MNIFQVSCNSKRMLHTSALAVGCKSRLSVRRNFYIWH